MCLKNLSRPFFFPRSMTAENLALVFAPGLVRTKIDDNPQAMLNYSHKQKLFIKNLMAAWVKE